MSLNTTELERLLRALQVSLDAFVEARSTDTADEDEPTANRLALAAALIAVAAFVIAALQALLQYVDSGQQARWRCDSAAIGPISAYVISTWSLRSWRRKFYYPVVPIGWGPIFRALQVDREEEPPLRAILRGFLDNHPECYWQPVTSHMDGLGVIFDGYAYLRRTGHQGTEKPVNETFRPASLPWSYWLKWRWYTFCQLPGQSQPRATWAQLLEAFDVGDYTTLETGRIDADCIPSALDVPPQRVSFWQLALLSFQLGMRDVQVDQASRHFQASGKLGSITTEEMSGFGKVIKFQRNTNKSRSQAAFNPGSWQGATLEMLSGNLYNGVKRRPKHKKATLPSGYVGLDDTVMFSAATFSVEAGRMMTASRESDTLGSPEPAAGNEDPHAKYAKTNGKFRWASEDLERWTMTKDPTEFARVNNIAIRHWRHNKGSINMVWPSILCAATVAGLPLLINGFPSRALLYPFNGIVQQLITSLIGTMDLHCRVVPDSCLDPLERVITTPFETGWCISTRAVVGIVPDGHVGWAYSEMESFTQLFQATERKKLDKFDELEAICTGSDIPVFDSAAKLLLDFDPVAYANSPKDPHHSSAFHRVQPEQLIWIQVYWLDLAIQRALRELAIVTTFSGPVWGRVGAESTTGATTSHTSVDPLSWRIYHAVVLSCSRNPETLSNQTPMGELKGHLVSLLYTPGLDEDRYNSLVDRLSLLIKLRAIFFIMFLLMIPDSSAVLFMSRDLLKVVHLPMI